MNNQKSSRLVCWRKSGTFCLSLSTAIVHLLQPFNASSTMLVVPPPFSYGAKLATIEGEKRPGFHTQLFDRYECIHLDITSNIKTLDCSGSLQV